MTLDRPIFASTHRRSPPWNSCLKLAIEVQRSLIPVPTVHSRDLSPIIYLTVHSRRAAPAAAA